MPKPQKRWAKFSKTLRSARYRPGKFFVLPRNWNDLIAFDNVRMWGTFSGGEFVVPLTIILLLATFSTIIYLSWARKVFIIMNCSLVQSNYGVLQNEAIFMPVTLSDKMVPNLLIGRQWRVFSPQSDADSFQDSEFKLAPSNHRGWAFY